jgi:hypothetical protein
MYNFLVIIHYLWTQSIINIKANYKSYGLLLISYWLWIKSQTWLATDIKTDCGIVDRIHDLDLVNRTTHYLESNRDVAIFHIAFTTFLIDITLLGIMFYSAVMNRLRFPIIYLNGILLRQICQFINRLPMPEHMVWFDPGVPTIFMVYAVANDFFFSGHTFTGIALGIELIGYNNWLMKIYGAFFIVYQMAFVLVTRAHYFMDVYAAIATYFMLRYFHDIYEKYYTELPPSSQNIQCLKQPKVSSKNLPFFSI